LRYVVKVYNFLVCQHIAGDAHMGCGGAAADLDTVLAGMGVGLAVAANGVDLPEAGSVIAGEGGFDGPFGAEASGQAVEGGRGEIAVGEGLGGDGSDAGADEGAGGADGEGFGGDDDGEGVGRGVVGDDGPGHGSVPLAGSGGLTAVPLGDSGDLTAVPLDVSRG
jgi:hypothetical protein